MAESLRKISVRDYNSHLLDARFIHVRDRM